MRMWMIDPELMCDKHLLGEHVETHMICGCLEKGKNIDGFLKKGLVNPFQVHDRHNHLVEEMVKRCFMHLSPLKYPQYDIFVDIDADANLKELARRCPKCRERIEAGVK